MFRLTNSDIASLIDLRHAMHRAPELSGHEAATAARIAGLLRSLGADQVLTGLGGHGVAAIWTGAAAGPTVLLRCELDALPIVETGRPDWVSQVPGVAHLCGHDGHMAMLTGVAHLLSRKPPARGRVVLMYQPAEEDGAGARAVVADPGYAAIRPDWAFAIHNFPGLPLGLVLVADGPVNCASRGMKVVLQGRTAHASQPETGTSPAPALARLMPALTALSQGTVSDADFRLATVTHATLGEPAFGIAPGAAELWVTLRSRMDSGMAAMVAAAEALVDQVSAAENLGFDISYHDIFDHCDNDCDAVAHITAAADAMGLTYSADGLPMRGSEDFGQFGKAGAKAAMLFLGAGPTADLHNPDYDFPDDLIPIGTGIFAEILHSVGVWGKDTPPRA
jgi:amidohydrolase